MWYRTLTNALKEEGFTPTDDDPCLFVFNDGTIEMKLGIHVDDGLVVSNSEESWRKVLTNLANKHGLTVSDSGAPKTFVGMNVTIGPDFVKLSHESKIKEIVREFLADVNKMYRSPASPGAKLDPTPHRGTKYRTLLGKLMHLAVWTRPDIAVDVGHGAKVQDNATEGDWKALLRIVGYLNSTPAHGLIYERETAVEASNRRIGKRGCIEGYVDADYAEDETDRKSVTGYVFFMAGAPIAWRSKKQACTSLSTTESEYVAATMAAQEAAWISRIAKNFGIDTGTMTLWEDNMGCIARTQKDPHYFRARAKHIATRYHYIRHQVKDGHIELEYCPTSEMAADMLTKRLAPQAHECKRGLLVRAHP